MRIILPTHLDVELIDPEYTWTCLDDPQSETFTPTINFAATHNGVNFTIPHALTPQPYVNGTWGDAEVDKAVEDYLNEINLEK